jgi:hypothetical protein
MSVTSDSPFALEKAFLGYAYCYLPSLLRFRGKLQCDDWLVVPRWLMQFPVGVLMMTIEAGDCFVASPKMQFTVAGNLEARLRSEFVVLAGERDLCPTVLPI